MSCFVYIVNINDATPVPVKYITFDWLFQGSPGVDGSPGEQGMQGNAGLPGVQGAPGPKGDQVT